VDQTTTIQPRATTAATGTLRVEVIAGPSKGATTLLDSDAVSVGSADGNTLVLVDPLVSRFHLELTREADAIRVVDLGSTNGTFIDTIRIERVRIQPGTVLRIGGSELRISAGRAMRVALLDDGSLPGLRGQSQVMRRLMATIQRSAAGSSSILITGESGTGKEVTASAIHRLGARADGPFVTVDCGAIPPSLIASELFGHERGAFTGADRQRIGAFERAEGGTLFLDEIGELGTDIQSSLLGVLERRRFRRVGGSDEIALDVRVLAATHRDLRAEVNAGRFRLDLYYRLAVVVLQIPPLRERPEDIPALVDHFLAELGSGATGASVFGATGLAELAARPWPGNVRELRNVVESRLVLGPDDEAPVAPAPGGQALPYKQARAAVTTEFERTYLTQLLAEAQNNVSRAARISQMDRSHLIELLHKHRLRGGGS
jgi:DNA-binding NtrC family response regulator